MGNTQGSRYVWLMVGVDLPCLSKTLPPKPPECGLGEVDRDRQPKLKHQCSHRGCNQRKPSPKCGSGLGSDPTANPDKTLEQV